MELFEKKIIDEFVEFLMKKIIFPEVRVLGFEKLEELIKKFIYILAQKLLQAIINALTDEIGFKKNLMFKVNNKELVFLKKREGEFTINSLFGEVKLPYGFYENKTTNKAIKINHVDYKEKDSTSPNVKKMISLLTPFEKYKESCEKLYTFANINMSLSSLKRVTNELAEEKAEWLSQEVKTKNEMSIKDNIRYQADRLVISNDGGKLKIITSNKSGRNAKKKPEWKEFKVGTVFEIDAEGIKTNNICFYGRTLCEWKDLESELNYYAKRFGLNYCRQFETLSDCGNGIKQMYVRQFDNPDNKKYFDVADFYHVSEHLWNLGDKIYPNKIDINKKSVECNNFTETCEKILLESGGEKLIEFFNLQKKNNRILNRNFNKNIHYFKNNLERLNYNLLKENNLPIGSGIMESTINTAVNERYKRNNIYWREDNANNLFSLGCTILNNDFDIFWKNRDTKLKFWNNIYDMQKN